MTKHYTTAQVVRLLELHPDWEFQAPVTPEMCEAKVHSSEFLVVFELCSCGSWKPDNAPNLRSDWTRVKPAKVKRERVALGTFRTNASGNQDGLGLGLAEAALKLYGMASNTTGNWTLYAVKDVES